MHLPSRLEDEQKFCTICVYYFLPVPLDKIYNVSAEQINSLLAIHEKLPFLSPGIPVY